MRDDLKRLLILSGKLKGPAAERLAAVEEMQAELACFSRLAREEQLQVLASVMGDVARLERAAAEAHDRYANAHECAQMLELVAQQTGSSSAAATEVAMLHQQIREATDSNEAILVLFRQQPYREWRPIEVRETLTAAGLTATKTMVESALSRLADRGTLTRASGRYRLAEPEEVVTQK